jgi:NTP pyrophosphatase (non-canonical NTP hydrolase)
MLAMLEEGHPVMMHVDTYYLKFLKSDSHYGAHCVIVADADEASGQALVADRSRDGLIEVPLAELAEARASRHKPFPPQNRWFEFRIPEQISIGPKHIMNAIGMNATEMLNSTIRNVGIGGIYYFATCLRTWESTYGKKALGDVCRDARQQIDGDGIGGGCFRNLYADFLQYAAKETGEATLGEVADGYRHVANMWSQLGKMLAEVECSCTSLSEASDHATAIATKEHELQVALMTAANLCCRRK